MNDKITELLETMERFEIELQSGLQTKREELRIWIGQGRLRFANQTGAFQQSFQRRLPAVAPRAELLNLLTSPAIYSMIVPLLLLDITITLYQTICFPGYGIPKVSRAKYIIHDRHRLSYLSGLEKFNCYYCSYANGLMAYAREITGRTEQYFCPIKHAAGRPSPHPHYHRFFDYGDGEKYRKELKNIRKDLQEAGEAGELSE
ncbi:MAG: hypothetical protein HY611_04025 [Elusimicrobia bacterium]|nr:hypothetical protein [Elusimicrobiota bacterium]